MPMSAASVSQQSGQPLSLTTLQLGICSVVRKLKSNPQPLPLHQQLLRNWFRSSETILIARVTAVTGFVVASLAAADWSNLLSLDFTNPKQILGVGLVALSHGLVTEAARRRPGSSDPV